MKVKFKRLENGQWRACLRTGKGGFGTLVVERTGTFWFAVKTFFNLKDWILAIKGK